MPPVLHGFTRFSLFFLLYKNEAKRRQWVLLISKRVYIAKWLFHITDLNSSPVSHKTSLNTIFCELVLSTVISHFHWGVLTTYTYHLRRRFTLSTQYPFNVSFAIASFEHALHVFLFFCHCIPTLIRSSSFFLQRIFEASFSNDIDIKGDRTDRGQRKSWFPL